MEEAEMRFRPCGIGSAQREGAHAAARRAYFPVAFAPIDHSGGILAAQQRIGGDVGIIEIDHQWNRLSRGTLNIYVARPVMPDAQHAGGIIERVAFLLEIGAARQGVTTGRDRIRRKVQTQNVRR